MQYFPRFVAFTMFYLLLSATTANTLHAVPPYAMPPVPVAEVLPPRFPALITDYSTRKQAPMHGANSDLRAARALPHDFLRPSASTPPAVKVSPLTARPGETIKLVITTDNCPGDVAAQDWLDENSLIIAGSDIATTFQQKDNCSITYTAVIAAKPTNSQLTILISGHEPKDKSTRISLPGGSFTFVITDAPALQPRPIPPGIAPQVDVMWNVMSEVACRDQYGSRLAKYYYCIDVALGNNSGYPLILAAVGFRRHLGSNDFNAAAASYLSTRAMTQEGQLISGRNITLRTLQASGALIAGFSPFSGNAGRRGRIAIWSTLFGSVLAAGWDAVVPDLTLKNVQNLDDAALRDGRVIPNNSPTRFSVFVDRDSIKPILLRAPMELRGDVQALGDKANSLRANANRESDDRKKDDLLLQAQKLEELAKKTDAEATRRIADKQDSTKPVKGFGPLGRDKAPLENNLIAVRFALGDLIIVGDQIAYLQRIQIDPAALAPSIEPTPEILSSPPSIKQGETSDIMLVGKGLAKATFKALQCGSFDKAEPDPSGNFVLLKNFKVTGCPASFITLYINNGSASTTFNMPITPAPQLDNKPQAVAMLTNPTATGSTATFDLTGKMLNEAKVKIVALDDGTQKSGAIEGTIIPSPSPTVIRFTANIPVAFAKAGVKAMVQVTTPAGGASNEVIFILK